MNASDMRIQHEISTWLLRENQPNNIKNIEKFGATLANDIKDYKSVAIICRALPRPISPSLDASASARSGVMSVEYERSSRRSSPPARACSRHIELILYQLNWVGSSVRLSHVAGAAFVDPCLFKLVTRSSLDSERATLASPWWCRYVGLTVEIRALRRVSCGLKLITIAVKETRFAWELRRTFSVGNRDTTSSQGRSGACRPGRTGRAVHRGMPPRRPSP